MDVARQPPLFSRQGEYRTLEAVAARAGASPGLFVGFVRMPKRHFCPVHKG
jgi:hypothetical protein